MLDSLKSLPKGRFDMAFADDGQILYLIAGQAHRHNFTNDIFTDYVINGNLFTFGGFNGGTFQDMHADDIDKQYGKWPGVFHVPSAIRL